MHTALLPYGHVLKIISFVFQRLEKGAEEDIAGQYFKPTGNRQAEILLKTQQTAEKAAKLGQGQYLLDIFFIV